MSSPEFDADAFTAFEAAGWERQAHAYHRFFAAVTAPVVAELLEACDVRPSSRVLDIATGPGYVAAACAAKGATVVGVDIAAEMVQLAHGLHPDLEFRQADAERLPFDDGYFDAVIGNFAILHLARPEQAVAEFARVLAPGGTVSLSVWDTPDRCRLAGVFVDAVAEIAAPPPAEVPPGPSFFRFSDDSAFVALLAGAALDDIRIRTMSYLHQLPSPDALWDGLLGGTVRTRAMVYGQPDETRLRIRAAFDRLVHEYLTAGGLDIPVSVKIASARRAA